MVRFPESVTSSPNRIDGASSRMSLGFGRCFPYCVHPFSTNALEARASQTGGRRASRQAWLFPGADRLPGNFVAAASQDGWRRMGCPEKTLAPAWKRRPLPGTERPGRLGKLPDTENRTCLEMEINFQYWSQMVRCSHLWLVSTTR